MWAKCKNEWISLLFEVQCFIFPDCLFLMLMIAIRVVNLSSSEQPRRHLFQTSEWLECFCLFQKVCCWRRLHSPQVCCDSCLPTMKAIPDLWFNFAIFFSICFVEVQVKFSVSYFHLKFSWSAVEFIFQFYFRFNSILEFSLSIKQIFVWALDDLQFGHSVICSRLLSLSLTFHSFRFYGLASF